MINITIIENDIDFSERIKLLLSRFFNRGKGEDIKLSEYTFIPEDGINWGEYCFIDIEVPDAEYIAGTVKKQYRNTKIVFVGECCDQKNSDIAVRGFSLGISGYILKTFTDEEILNVFDYLFNPL